MTNNKKNDKRKSTDNDLPKKNIEINKKRKIINKDEEEKERIEAEKKIKADEEQKKLEEEERIKAEEEKRLEEDERRLHRLRDELAKTKTGHREDLAKL